MYWDLPDPSADVLGSLATPSRSLSTPPPLHTPSLWSPPPPPPAIPPLKEHMVVLSQQTKALVPMPNQCWADVCDAGPTLIRHWDKGSCFLGCQQIPKQAGDPGLILGQRSRRWTSIYPASYERILSARFIPHPPPPSDNQLGTLLVSKHTTE